VASVTGATEPAEVVCTVDDPRAVELSGLVATPDGYVSIVDSRSDAGEMVIVYLDEACRVVRTQGYLTVPGDLEDPDPEDLAVAPDGALWVGDIGDNILDPPRRQTITVWRIPPDGGDPVNHRLTYPDGPHDAEALLIAADGTPIIITKEISDTANVYQATRALDPGSAAGVPLALVGGFHPEVSGVPNELGPLGEVLVTGAATAPDRSRVVLRTYTAAYEFDVPDGDVATAITTGRPRITLLPDEPQGEAIAYTVDGQSFLTVSDEPGPTTLRRYRPAPGPPTQPSAPADPPGASAAGQPSRYGIALAIASGALILGAAIWFVVRRRRP
jgi:hypothetical protein